MEDEENLDDGHGASSAVYELQEAAHGTSKPYGSGLKIRLLDLNEYALNLFSLVKNKVYDEELTD